MIDEINYLGYLKYKGQLVDAGFMDARKSAEALLGFDEIVRHFVLKEKPDLHDSDFEIPVRIQKGSWIAFIPETIGQWILVGGGIVATAYLATAAKKMAEKDFVDAGFKDIFRGALKSAQWAIKIAIHCGTITKKKFENVKFRKDNQEIGIPNDRDEYLYVPKEELEKFVGLPENIFSKNTALIEEERILSIGVYENGVSKEVDITHKEKAVFFKKAETDEILFPELVHGQQIELDGVVTRGNKNSNTLGFEYQGHILNCIPMEGSITRFKNSLFTKARITGVIDRSDEFGNPVAQKPQIVISNIIALGSEESLPTLF